MKINYQWLKEFVDIELSPRLLASNLTMIGHAVDSVEEVGEHSILEFDLTSNRPDCLSHLGIAREVSALTGKPWKLPFTQLKESQTRTEQVTAVEWLDAERQARVEDDSHRPITEASFARPQPADEPREDAAPAEPETPADARDDLPAGVPTPAETAMAALRARDALDRIAARTAEERDHAAEADDQTQRELAWRHADAQATEAEDADVR